VIGVVEIVGQGIGVNTAAVENLMLPVDGDRRDRAPGRGVAFRVVVEIARVDGAVVMVMTGKPVDEGTAGGGLSARAATGVIARTKASPRRR